jgi:formamidopyrimidine-DNA glycosylase
MPELPEVEITRRGIAPAVVGQAVSAVVIRHYGLRWPVPRDLPQTLKGLVIRGAKRRAKYLLLETVAGHLIIHLGMSGSLRVVPASEPPAPWDHVDIVFGSVALRLRDPRRFGAVLWEPGPIHEHKLLRALGVEPLSDALDGTLLHAASRTRAVGVKLFLMDHSVVVGVGNIYANESLFRAGINPKTRASRIALGRYDALARAVKSTLAAALEAGGSSLRDFVHSDGTSGYFQQQYSVYDRAGEPCRSCGATIKRIVQGQRSTFYCPVCQRV